MCKGVFKKAYFVFVRTAGIGTISKEETGPGGGEAETGKSQKNG